MLPIDEKLDSRVKRTRGLILQSFESLLTEKGYQSLTVQNITEGAGVNRATFYAHFPDKYALLDFSIQQMFRLEIEKRKLNACHYSDENLRALIVAVCEFVSNAHSHCSSPESQFESLMEAQVKNQLQEWLEQVGSDVDSKTTATAADCRPCWKPAARSRTTNATYWNTSLNPDPRSNPPPSPGRFLFSWCIPFSFHLVFTGREATCLKSTLIRLKGDTK